MKDKVPFLPETKSKGLKAKYTAKEPFASYAVADGTVISGQNNMSAQDTAELVLKALA